MRRLLPAALIVVLVLSLQASTSASVRHARILYAHPIDAYRSTGAFAVDLDGADAHKVTRYQPVWDPAWDVTHTGIFFDSETGGRPPVEIYHAAIESSTATRLSNGTMDEASPRPSPDGSRLVFVGYRTSNNPEIYTLSLKTGRRERLTINHVEDDGPVWAPDGFHIAWIHDGELWTMGGHGQHPHAVGGGFGSLDPTSPDWAPHGHWIVFSTAGYDIYRARSDGSHLRKVVWDPGTYEPRYRDPVWSPDGRWIAYTRTRYDEVAEVWTSRVYAVHPDGSGARLVKRGAVSRDW